MVSKIIKDLDMMGVLGGFNQNQVRDIFQGFFYDVMDAIGGERGSRKRGVEEGDIKSSIPFSMFQVFEWVGEIHLLPWYGSVFQ